MRRLRRARDHTPPASPREFVSGESVLYLGRHYRLKVDPRATGDAKLRGGWLHVPALGEVQKTAHVRAALVSWFRRQAAERLPERVEAWRSKVGTPMPRVIVADQQKRWGSCNQRGTIRLNWRIIQVPRCGSSTMSSSTSWCISSHRGHGPSELLAGRRTGYAGLRAAPRGTAAVRNRVGVVGITAASCSSVVISKCNVWAERA